MVDRTLPKVGLPYGVAQGYFTEKKIEKKKKIFGAKERMRILITSPSRMTIVVPSRSAPAFCFCFCFCFFFLLRISFEEIGKVSLCKFWFLKKSVLQVSMLKYVWTLSLRNFSAVISRLLAILRISKLKLMETETDKQTLTKLHLLNMNDCLSLGFTSRKQCTGKKLTVSVEDISKSKKSKHGIERNSS